MRNNPEFDRICYTIKSYPNDQKTTTLMRLLKIPYDCYNIYSCVHKTNAIIWSTYATIRGIIYNKMISTDIICTKNNYKLIVDK